VACVAWKVCREEKAQPLPLLALLAFIAFPLGFARSFHALLPFDVTDSSFISVRRDSSFDEILSTYDDLAHHRNASTICTNKFYIHTVIIFHAT